MFQNVDVKILQSVAVSSFVARFWNTRNQVYVSSLVLLHRVVWSGSTWSCTEGCWKMLYYFLGGSVGELLVGSPCLLGGGGGWTGIDREGVVWYGWASSIIVDLGERIKKGIRITWGCTGQCVVHYSQGHRYFSNSLPLWNLNCEIVMLRVLLSYQLVFLLCYSILKHLLLYPFIGIYLMWKFGVWLMDHWLVACLQGVIFSAFSSAEALL